MSERKKGCLCLSVKIKWFFNQQENLTLPKKHFYFYISYESKRPDFVGMLCEPKVYERSELKTIWVSLS